MIPVRRFQPLRALALLIALLWLTPVQAGGSLVPPPGYDVAVGHRHSDYRCPDMPAPYTGTLDFPSKYQGSGKARDQLNKAADAEYKRLTLPITQMEKGANKIVAKYMETGDADTLRCVFDWYGGWAQAQALLGPSATHTGKSMRKWALASLSGAWLHLEFSQSQPLAADPQRAQAIEQWLGRIADRVTTEWDTHLPLRRINNHYYWAAWAVMATAVVTNRRDLFDWSKNIYDIFAGQVDADGYLPNELARNTRALGYHNYAITPIAMIAAFGKANGVDLAAEGGGALQRLAQRTLAGVADPAMFETKTGYKQELENVEENTKFAWLEPYCWTIHCSGAAAAKLVQLRPLRNTRLGGDLTAVFGTTS